MGGSKAIRVLFASAEAAPFSKTGGLGDVAGTLPPALVAAGAECAVAMPRYSSIPSALLEGSEPVADLEVPSLGGSRPCRVERVEREGVAFYLYGNDGYFGRDRGLYGYDDDVERFAFFSRAICEALLRVPEMGCDVVHCNDWQTALVPVYLRSLYGSAGALRGVKTVFTVHNAMFQGKADESALAGVLGLGDEPVAATACTMDDGSVNLMKGALTFADHLSTVSPSYVGELKTPQYGERLDPVFRRRSGAFTGVLNGIDQDGWNPASDPALAERYSAGDLSGKAVCKAALQREMGLSPDPDRPLVAMVTRLSDQKGVGLVIDQVERLMARGVQLVVLGTGEAWMEERLASQAAAHPGQMSAAMRFDSALSHRIYAGADLFLMPSVFEPCGLSQIISMRYGTLPVVRETGGLRDSVQPYNKYTGEGTGFSFANADADEMGDILLNACEVYWTDKAAWARLQQQAMAADFSWSRAAGDYLAMYRGVVEV